MAKQWIKTYAEIFNISVDGITDYTCSSPIVFMKETKEIELIKIKQINK